MQRSQDGFPGHVAQMRLRALTDDRRARSIVALVFPDGDSQEAAKGTKYFETLPSDAHKAVVQIAEAFTANHFSSALRRQHCTYLNYFKVLNCSWFIWSSYIQKLSSEPKKAKRIKRSKVLLLDAEMII